MQHTDQLTCVQCQCGRKQQRGLLRSISPTVVAITVSLLIGGAGLADAATGGSFELGRANAETSTASLINSKGTPLSLYAPAGKAALSVNRNTMVSNLNAQYVGGLTADALATGGEGFTLANTDTPIGFSPSEVTSTGKLAAGTYYVSATALLDIATGDVGGTCWIATGSNLDYPINSGESRVEGVFSVAETAAVTVTAGSTLQEGCDTGGNNGSIAEDAGIIAIRVLSSSHK